MMGLSAGHAHGDSSPRSRQLSICGALPLRAVPGGWHLRGRGGPSPASHAACQQHPLQDQVRRVSNVVLHPQEVRVYFPGWRPQFS